MRSSPEIGELAGALAKAQAKMEPPKKDRTADIKSAKGSYSYHYSDLASLIDAIRGPLTENGIAWAQPIYWADGALMLETRLMHSSGQWIAGDYPLATCERPQDQGSAITYARRYALGAIVGLAPEDDDGEAAQKAQPKPASRREPEKAHPGLSIDDNIHDVAEQIVMAFGGDPAELIARASAFPKEDDDARTASKKLDAIRWTGLDNVVLAPHNQWIKGGRLPKSEKWKKGTLAKLLARRDALRAEPTDAELQAEGRDAEAEAMQAQFDETPY